MTDYDEAARAVNELVAELEGHHSSNPDGVETACTLTASTFGADLKTTIENAKKQDFMGTLTGLVTLAQQAGQLELCGVELEKTHLVRAAQSLCPRQWAIVEEQLRAFGESAYEKIMEG